MKKWLHLGLDVAAYFRLQALNNYIIMPLLNVHMAKFKQHLFRAHVHIPTRS